MYFMIYFIYPSVARLSTKLIPLIKPVVFVFTSPFIVVILSYVLFLHFLFSPLLLVE